ncbi:MAG TPA: ABC-F family ATP-binding cassette domain-containing protein [Saprospiraceae bacterium]|nr:ABC-F family ATP-binding cassette domain-containing protein [Saprospiraceae bacterium]
MEYLRIEDVSKRYGTKVLLDEVSLHVSAGDKVALIAKNGSGKTTLLEIVAGIEPGEGQNHRIILNQDIRVGYLKQEPQFNPEMTLMEAMLDSGDVRLQTLRQYKKSTLLEEKEEQQKYAQKMDDLQLWDLEYNILGMLAKVKLDNPDRRVRELSGGQVKRLALAKIIIEDYDFLILDEPTNHLDLEMIEWLEQYLLKPSLTLFMVTHDRYFLERVCNYMLELDRGKLNKFKGNYSDYLHKKEQMIETEAATQEKRKKLFSRELDWIRRQPKARGTKAKSRVEEFERLKEDISDNTRQDEELEFMLPGRRLGKKILEFRQTQFAYDDKKILNPFDYKFKKNEKIGIVGPNGAGKTTLVKIITGEIKPDKGRIVVGETVHFGHYRQDGQALNKDLRVLEQVRQVAEYLPLPNGKELSAERLLERFLFPREQHRVYVSQLSGGEQKRLQLLCTLMHNPNFLILDEPTNDLDILTLNVLESFLKGFPGCLIVISHDRYFLDKLVDHLWVLDGNGNIKDYNGGYSRYRDEFGLNFDHSETKAEQKEENELGKSDAKEEYELRKVLRRIEKDLEKLEKEKDGITQKLYNPDIDQEEMIELSKRLKTLEKEIEACEEEWMLQSETLE